VSGVSLPLPQAAGLLGRRSSIFDMIWDRDKAFISPTMGTMHSLETEYRELNAAGLIDEVTTSRAIALERGEIFSLFEEVRFALYAAVAAITAGVGILVKENLEHIGPLTLIVALAVIAAACYGTAILTHRRRETRSIGGDYVLLLGALIASADWAYAEAHFHWSGDHWSWGLLMLTTVHAITAYALDSRLVLSLALTSLASWFGVQGHIQVLFAGEDPLRSSGIQALACASTMLIWREINLRLRLNPAFVELLEHFSINVAFWGALALSSTPATRLYGVVVLFVLALVSVRKGLQNSLESFVIYGIVYTTLGLCLVEAQMLSDLRESLMELVTIVVAVILLWRFRHRPKAVAA
jgi:hypothetical protein